MSHFQCKSWSVLVAIFMVITNFSILPTYAAQDSTVVGYIGEFRSNDSSLPAAVNQKGKIGTILAEIFYGSADGALNGKIKKDYLDLSGIVNAWLLDGTSISYTAGNVGIGTSSPVTKFNVTNDGTTKTPYDANELFQFHGGIASYGTVSGDSVTLGIGTYDFGGDGIFTSADEGGFVGTLNSAPLNFRVANAEKMRITTTGNVGIGTSSPAYKLDVSGTVNATAFRGDGSQLSNVTIPWSGISGAPGFATNAVNERVRAYELGCESGWGSSCDANTNGRIDNADNSSTVGWLGIGSLRQFNAWQNNHYSGTDGAEHATIFYDTNNSGYYLDPSGTSNINALVVGGGISDSAGVRMDAGGGWMRTYGNTGWFNGTYAWGWYMTDSTWIRAYNSKSVYSPGEMQATTLRGNTNVCIGSDCRTAWPATGGGITSVTTASCTTTTYCTATCPAGYFRTWCAGGGPYSTSVYGTQPANGCAFYNSNWSSSTTSYAYCAK